MPLVVLSEKVQPEVLEQWKKAKEESEAQTGNQFVELILEAFLNPKVKTVHAVKPSDEQAAEVLNLSNEIGRLKTLIDLQKDQILTLEEANNELGHRNAELETRPEPGTRNPEPGTVKLEVNQEIITVPPVVSEILNQEAATAARKSGKQFSRGDILLNCFWETIKDGQFVPFKIWSNSELKEVTKKVQAAQQV